MSCLNTSWFSVALHAERISFALRPLILLFALLGLAAAPALAQPANDNFANATIVDPASLPTTADNPNDQRGRFTGMNNYGATAEPGEPGPGWSPARTVWWRITPTENGELIISGNARQGTLFILAYTGSSLGSLSSVGNFIDRPDGDSAELVLDATAGETYYIQADGEFGTQIIFDLAFAFAPTPPPNDDFADAIEIDPSTLPATLTGTNADATAEPGESSGSGGTGINSVWWKVTPTTGGEMTVNTNGSDFDTVLDIYTGSSVDNLTFITGASEDEDGTSPEVTFPAFASNGTYSTYYIRVDGRSRQTGAITLNVLPPTPPPNDDFADAIEIDPTTFPVLLTGTTIGATAEPGETGGDSVLNTVWWKITPITDGNLEVNTSAGGISTVFTGSSVDNLSLVGSSDFAFVSFEATAGETYYIQIDGNEANTPDFELNIFAEPPNDDFANAIAIDPLALPASVTGTLHTLWWKITPTTDGDLVVDTFGSDFDTVLGVYTGASVDNLNTIAANDDAGGTLQSKVTFAATAGTTYYLQVDGGGRSRGSTILNVAGSEINVTDGTTTLDNGTGVFDVGTVDGVATDPEQTFTIENNGSTNLTISDITLSNTTDFAITQAHTSPVAPGASTGFIVQFTAAVPGTYTTTVSIDNNDSSDTPYTFSVTATADAPEADVFVETSTRTALDSGGTFDFGSVTVGTSSTETFTIENNGGATLTLTPPSSIPGVFDVTATGGTMPPLAPGQAFTFDVTFTPSSVGTVSESFSISNNDPDENPYAVTLTGTGLNAEPTVATNTGGTLSQGRLLTITQSQLETTDANDGPADLTYTATSGPAHGQLLLNGVASATFTQADLNSDAVTYINDGTGAVGDSFAFDVSDGTATSSNQTFALTVGSDAAFSASASAAVEGTSGSVSFPGTGVAIDFSGATGTTGTVHIIRLTDAPAYPGTALDDLIPGDRFVVTVVGDLDVSGGVDLQVDATTFGFDDLPSIQFFTRDTEGSTEPLAPVALTYDPATDQLSTPVARFGEITTAASTTFATTIVGTDGTGTDAGFRMVAFPAGFTASSLTDDVDFSVTTGSVLQTFPGGSADGSGWVEVTDPANTAIGRAEGFILYFFDDATDPLESGGIQLDVPDDGASQTTEFTTPAFDVNDEYELVGNPYAENYDLGSLTDLTGAGFGATVAIWNPILSQYNLITQGDPGSIVPAFNAFVVQRTTVGSGATSLTFAPDGKQGTASPPIGSNAAALADSDVRVIELQMEATEGSTVSRSVAKLRLAPEGSVTTGWDTYDFSALVPPASSGGYALAGFPFLRNGNAVLRAVASEPYTPTSSVDLEVPLHVQGVELGGTATLTWPDAVQTPEYIPADWSLELVDTAPGNGASPVVHDLHNGGPYAFDLASSSSPPDPAQARFLLRITAAPLPVELSAFDAVRDGEAIALSWQTLSETNNAGFHVERRTDSLSTWSPITFVGGAGTTDAAQTYRFRDADLPFGAEQVTYRLRQVDTDGTESISEERTLQAAAPTAVRLHAPFPNPARGAATLRYELPEATDIRIGMYDLLGRRVARLADHLAPAGRYEAQVSTRHLAPGTYFVQIRAHGTVHTQRLTVVR